MSLDVAYSYCINLTEEKKLEIDKQVRKNRFELRFAIFFPVLFPTIPMPQLPFAPVDGLMPQQIVRNARDRAESAIAEKLTSVAQLANDCQEAYSEYKVYNEMSSTLSKVSKKARKDEQTNEGLDELQEQLNDGEFQAGRDARKLPGSKNIFHMREGGEARLFFRYAKDERGKIEVLAESNKDEETKVIKN